MRKFLNKKNIFLKDKTINEFMKNGKKTTGEKILLKFTKSFQKAHKKKFITLLQFAIINATSVFSLNTQVIKKGKRKTVREIPSFLSNHDSRIRNSLKLFKESSSKEKRASHFYKSFKKEVLKSASLSSASITKKTELQKQVLLNKRYWYNFKW